MKKRENACPLYSSMREIIYYRSKGIISKQKGIAKQAVRIERHDHPPKSLRNKLMLAPYGYSTMIKILLLCMVCGAAAMLFPAGMQIGILLFIGIFILFTLYFFRDPQRTAPDEQRIILAPADGTIMLVQPHSAKAVNSEGNPPTLVSIFMSPFNVHVNRVPLSGKVTHLRYCPGKFLMAFDHQSMESNEKMEIGIDNGEIEVQFNQVSGFLARRIVCTLQRGEMVKMGKRFGMIKFGSRVDIILPPSATVTVQPGEKTRAGETIVARY